jgi:hypothetical protein
MPVTHESLLAEQLRLFQHWNPDVTVESPEESRSGQWTAHYAEQDGSPGYIQAGSLKMLMVCLWSARPVSA